MHWLAHFLGLDSASGPAYLAFSGAGGDLGELAIIGALLAVIRRHKCQVHKCWRVSIHETAAGHRVCPRHHPGHPLTARDIAEEHHRAVRRASHGSAERLYDPGRDGGES